MVFENFEIAIVLFKQFQNFQKYTRAFFSKSPSHPVITSTKWDIAFSDPYIPILLMV